MQTSNYGYEKTVGGRKMKPIIIIKETNKDGKFELTEKELRELVEQAYNQGFEDGKERNQAVINPTWREQPIKTIPLDRTEPRYNDIYGKPIPNITAWNATTSTQPNEDSYTLT